MCLRSFCINLTVVDGKEDIRLPVASIENKDIIKFSDLDPVICRNINIHSVYAFHSILIRLIWLPPIFSPDRQCYIFTTKEILKNHEIVDK